MRIMGIDTNSSLVHGKEYSVLSVSIIDDNGVASINALEVDSVDDSLCDSICRVFSEAKCDYLIMDISGQNIELYHMIKKSLSEDKLKCKVYNDAEINNLIVELIKNNCLNKLGIELKYEHKYNGCLRFATNEYTDFALSSVYAIGVANHLYNELNKIEFK